MGLTQKSGNIAPKLDVKFVRAQPCIFHLCYALRRP
jgi:hypothetical protein